MDSSTDSDEENLEKLREATATKFINDKMFKEGIHEDTEAAIGKLQRPASLRPVKDDQEQFNLLNVTPEFQRFVAKRLDEHMEEELQKRLVSNIEYKPRKKRKRKGIKLLSDSETFITLRDESFGESNAKRVEIKKRIIENEVVDEDVKVKLCAINSADIFSKKETEFWTDRRRGEVFSYKRTKDGQLVCIEKEFK